MKELSKYVLNKIKANKCAWNEISRDYKLSEEFIREYQDKVKWSLIVAHQELTEEFILEFKDKIRLSWIDSRYLNKSLVKEFKDQINWQDLTIYQYLSEEFITENKDKAHWKCISYYNNCSEKFVIDNKEYIYFPYLMNKTEIINTYSKQTQKLILSNLINNNVAHFFKDCFTSYMEEQYERLETFI